VFGDSFLVAECGKQKDKRKGNNGQHGHCTGNDFGLET
jgi:hypothetical protein